jgi:hypothetical protein
MGKYTVEQVAKAVARHFGDSVPSPEEDLDFIIHELAHWFTFETFWPENDLNDLSYYISQHLNRGKEDCGRGFTEYTYWLYGRELVALAAQEAVLEMADDDLELDVKNAFGKSMWQLKEDLDRVRGRRAVAVVAQRIEAWVCGTLAASE